MASRESLAFETTIKSDCAPLADTILALLAAGIDVHCLRDLTRGGLGAALVEIAGSSGQRIDVQEAAIPVRPDVHAACELLGLEALYVANEGRFVAFVAPGDAGRALEVLHQSPLGEHASCIGRVAEGGTDVTMTGPLGTTRIIDLPSGEQLPRIC